MNIPPGYTPADVERWVHDSPSERSPFTRDRARVLHSAGLRRLAATTHPEILDAHVDQRLIAARNEWCVWIVARDSGVTRSINCEATTSCGV